jgi:MFS family permease
LNRRVSRLIAGWRTGLSRPVLILQGGGALNFFGYGLVLPFEIISLHQMRGLSTVTAGLVLAATMATSAVVAPPTGALLDRYSAKAVVVAGSLASALGYAGFAFVERPWQGFACSIVGGVGLGVAGTANRTLVVRLVRPEQRAAAFALDRVAGNFGIGAGATVGGFIVAAGQQLSTFQLLYFFDAVTYAGFAFIVLAAVPSARAEIIAAADGTETGFRAVARDRIFLVLGPLVADMAPAHLLGRYLSLYSLTFTASLALGPAIGGLLLQTSPDAIWWGGALAAALAGAVLLRLDDRIPDPLREAQSRVASGPLAT